MTKPLAQEAQELSQRCRETAEKASPGPWDILRPVNANPMIFSGPDHIATTFRNNAAAFIASARSDVPALCDMIDRLVAENERLRADLFEAMDEIGGKE